jgi:hypothetical protein
LEIAVISGMLVLDCGVLGGNTQKSAIIEMKPGAENDETGLIQRSQQFSCREISDVTKGVDPRSDRLTYGLFKVVAGHM